MLEIRLLKSLFVSMKSYYMRFQTVPSKCLND